MSRSTSAMPRSSSVITGLGALLALFLLVPVIAFVVRFAAPGDHGFTQAGVWSALLTSVVASSISTAIILAFGVPLAHWLAVSGSRIARVVGVLVQLPLALPPVMSGIVLIYVVGPYTPIGELFGGALTDSLAGVVIAQTFVAAPFLVIGARSAFRGVDPSLAEVAAGLGYDARARFLRVAVPAAADGIRAALVLTWLRALGEYGATALLAYHPYTLPVFVNVQFQSAGLPATQAPTALALALAIIAVAIGIAPRPRRRRRSAMPASRAPGSRDGFAIGFHVEVHRDSFAAAVAMEGESCRIAILGPSGAGKSLTLRGVGGHLGSSGGAVRIGGVDVFDLPPERRNIGLVAQGGVLQPRRSVWEQALFGVGTVPAVAAWWLRTLHVDHLADRLPEELSGGERQRVALAQVLSREPSVILLDEPFSALDGPIRDELRREFRRLQLERSLSTVVVTHDPAEAAALADYVLVLDQGRVLQQGPLAEVYRAPSTVHVARLVGVENVNAGVLDAQGAVHAGDAVVVTTAEGTGGAGPVLWAVRPEAVVVGGGAIAATVTDVVDRGDRAVVELELDGSVRLVAHVGPAEAPRIGDRLGVGWDPATVRVWSAAG